MLTSNSIPLFFSAWLADQVMLTALATVCLRLTFCNHSYALVSESLDKDAYVALSFGGKGFFFAKQFGCTFV